MLRHPSSPLSRAVLAGACVLALALAGCDKVPKPKA